MTKPGFQPAVDESVAETGKKGSARHPFFISTPRNLEPLLAEELKEMGITEVTVRPLGVEATMSREEGYRVVYGSRLASRVLRPLATFPCRDPEELYAQAARFNWTRIMKTDQTLKVTASVSDSTITHSHYAALKLKDAIVDNLREKTGERPSIDRETPDVRLDLYLRQDQATISLYYSDGIMHRRGYPSCGWRTKAAPSPFRDRIPRFSGRFHVRCGRRAGACRRADRGHGTGNGAGPPSAESPAEWQAHA
jgi:23S rRNA (guanine2445-N2)-methyltransferase / 23S rRNA (guanine2069-N7)-methyltransferase